MLTVTPGAHKAKGKEHTVPIDCVIRTRWPNAAVDWNGSTVIL